MAPVHGLFHFGYLPGGDVDHSTASRDGMHEPAFNAACLELVHHRPGVPGVGQQKIKASFDHEILLDRS
jgi:hypothetical protein